MKFEIAIAFVFGIAFSALLLLASPHPKSQVVILFSDEGESCMNIGKATEGVELTVFGLECVLRREEERDD